MRSSRLAVIGGAALALAVAACSSAQAPGWTYQPAASVTPAPSSSASGEPSSSAAPSGSAPSASAGPSQSGGTALTVVAQSIAFEPKELQATADTAFQISFDNRDAIQHDVDIRGADGAVLDDNQVIPNVGQITYDVPALAAGEYVFICSVHPVPAMTGKLTVQ